MKLVIICLVVLTYISSYAQHSCCTAPSHAQAVASTSMIAFANDEEFVKAHAEPLPFKVDSLKGKMITFPCADKKNANAYVVNMKPEPRNIVFMFQEWWGVNDYIKQEADRLSKKLDVTVVAIDLYDGKVATTREEAQQYVKEVKETRLNIIIAGAYSHFPASAKYATIGWCFGGGWSLKAALFSPDTRIKGCVMYYGSPETDADNLMPLACPVLGIFGSKDKWLTPKVVSDFETAMTKAGKQLTVKSYDADHAFANPSNPNYNKAATEDARKLSDAFIKKAFGLK
jgi:carboxymethylenebutenolidase